MMKNREKRGKMERECSSEKTEIFVDCHLHTSFSGDSETKPEDVLQAARRRGLSGVIPTDHLDWDYREEPGLFDLDFDRYFETLTALRAKDPMLKGIGLELGLQERLADRHKELLETYPFDFVIGSVHVVNGRDPYYPSYFEGRSIRDSYIEYFEAVLSNLKAFHGFDTLGHLDYVGRYGKKYAEEKGLPKEDARIRYEDYREWIDPILMFLIRHGIALEVNTGAFRYGGTEPNPSTEILKAYHDLGGRLVTIGSDAHTPEYVGSHFEDLRGILHQAGFDGYTVYLSRKEHAITI